VIKGTIIQKTRDGLFVQSDAGHAGGQRDTGTSAAALNSSEPAGHDGPQIFEGLCLLKGHPEQATFAEGDQVNIRAKESGLYQYTAVSGTVRSIKQFTAD
jgi:hypothetical protein